MSGYKVYQSREVVKARPMSREEYNSYRGWVATIDNNSREEGYMVVHGTGSSIHYVTWCPKKEFDMSHTEQLLSKTSEK